MLVALLANLSVLCVFKYYHFALEQLNRVLNIFGFAAIQDRYSFIAPLGISFYTFQSIGYLLDSYWEKVQPEKNFLKVLLFVSFFPQMTQGPISSYSDLHDELFTVHSFEYDRYVCGAERMIWGFFKKMVVADALAPCVKDVFLHYSQYSGITVFFGAICYSIQIYADFSGYMDIMCGFCEVLGIKLTENFMRPYFSKSITEYWRRWHISMGTWFKNYVYYPIGMSKWSRDLAKKCKEKFGKNLGNTIPATIALVVTWTATGLWHGASWAYITWGLVNGLFIIFLLWMEPVYAQWKQKLKINDGSLLWRAFQVVRTFILVTFIKVLPEVGTLSEGLGLWKQIFTNHEIPGSIYELLPFINWSITIYVVMTFLAIMGTILLFVVSLLQRKQEFRVYFNKLPMVVRMIILTGMILLISSFGVQATWGTGGFIYANF